MDVSVWDNFDPSTLIENWDTSVESGSNNTSPLSSPILEFNFLETQSDLLDLPIDVRTQLSPNLLQSPHICISEGIFACNHEQATEIVPVLEPAKRGRPKKKRQRGDEGIPNLDHINIFSRKYRCVSSHPYKGSTVKI
jgi:hypothetical protein